MDKPYRIQNQESSWFLLVLPEKHVENPANAQQTGSLQVNNSSNVLYANEFWKPSKCDLRLLENFNKKLLKWIVSQKSYSQALWYLNVLPIPYFQVLKDLLTLSSIMIGNFDCQISDFVKINPSSREGPFILPSIRYELQRSNYWYRACHRADLIWNIPEGLKGRILNLMCIYFSNFFNDHSTCIWTFPCFNFCRLRNPISEL